MLIPIKHQFLKARLETFCFLKRFIYTLNIVFVSDSSALVKSNSLNQFLDLFIALYGIYFKKPFRSKNPL